MKRYYYTDPIATAYMGRKFGMQFLGESGEKISFGVTDNSIDWWLTDELDQGIGYVGIRFYIAQNSLPILEPQDGDGVEFDRWQWDRERHEDLKDAPYQPHYALVKIDEKWKHIFSSGIGWDTVRPDEKFSLPLKIIQRNGIPFMWPEVEEASDATN